ncbi:MAG: MFS transporter [Candidatus Heimdallarchaeota archaeon]|nr:MFS transporter [Candidatus Heimdallarchaeota archaeon]
MSDEQSFNEDDVKKISSSNATEGSSSENYDKATEIHSSIDEDIMSKKELRKRLGLFYLISIGNATGQTFLFNFFSAFAVLVGVTSSMLGFITSIRNLMSSLFQGAIGRLSDKYGRRYFLLIGFFLVFSSLVILIFINSPVMLIIISIIQAFSLSLIIPVWNATLGDVTKIDERATYIGKLSAIGTAISVTLMLGLAVLFYLLDDVFVTLTLPSWYEERIKYEFAFMLAAFNFLLCILGAFLLRETCCLKEKKHKQPSMFLALKNPDFKKFFIVNSIFGLIMASMWPIFPIAQVTVLEMDFAQIAIINAIFSTSSSLAQFFGGKLGDRIGRKPLLIFSRMSMFIIPLVMIGAILIDNWLLLIISNIIGGAGIGALNVSQNAYILDLAPNDQMGAYSGLTQVGWGITTFIGSLSAGFIADVIESSVGTKQMVIITFIAITVLRFFASLGFFFIKESFPQKAREELQEKRNAEKISKYPPVLASCEDSSTQTK